MTFGRMINKLRTDAGLSQQQFARVFGVSQQSVGKWENGTSQPDLEKLMKISKYFDISLDALILGNDSRVVEEMKYTKKMKPKYSNLHPWESYSSDLLTEYEQSTEEGLDIAIYKDLFAAVSRLPQDETKKKLGDILFDIVLNAKQRDDYPYIEPSDLESIQALRQPYDCEEHHTGRLEERISGAWMGRVCGCMLGKTVEGIKTDELVSFLKETGNYPMHRYICRKDLNEDILSKYTFHFINRIYADEIDGMPVDDDTNYTVLAQIVIDKYGREFTPYDVSRTWLDYQKKDAYCTAERVAFCNFVKGYEPPQSASYQNPYREWIGAQIRADYFGYINPGNPEKAAEMAWRDASISHIKNGIYGEMFVAAMIAVSAVTQNLEDIILGGLAQIPSTSRLYEAVKGVFDDYQNGVSCKEVFRKIHKKYNEYTVHGWCHTISNAMIVAASLLYGNGNYGKSVCMAVETGFDTDCNGATVGSILGMANGIGSIPDCWTKPIHDTLHTSIFGVDTVKISDRVAKTMEHIAK